MSGGSARLAFDVGGTFIDFVLQGAGGELATEKLLADPSDLVGGIHRGVARLLEEARVAGDDVGGLAHATTLGSNAVLERRGPNVALVTTRGFRDVLHIQRSLRYSMYDVQIEKRPPLIPRSRIHEVTERCRADGTVLEPLAEEEVVAIARELRASGCDAVAVAYLHSYVAPAHERRTRELLRAHGGELHVTISSEVSLQGREYERVSTAVVNAYLAPVLGAYLRELARRLPELGISAPLWMMQSSGGLALPSGPWSCPCARSSRGPPPER